MTLDTRFQLAVLYQENKRTREAIDLFNGVLEVDPKYTSIYPILGQAYEQEQQLEDAYRVYQEGLAQDETNTVLYRLAGLAAEKLGDDAKAKAYYQNALALDDTDVTSIIILSALLLKQREFEADIQLLEKHIQEDVIDPEFYWHLARAYYQEGKEDQATKYWEMALPFFQENTSFLRDIIDWYHEEGERQGEIDMMVRYLNIEPEDSDMQMRLENAKY